MISNVEKLRKPARRGHAVVIENICRALQLNAKHKDVKDYLVKFLGQRPELLIPNLDVRISQALRKIRAERSGLVRVGRGRTSELEILTMRCMEIVRSA